jgi:preprotein translocase subunit SecD
MRRRLVPLILIVLVAASGLSAALVTDSSPELGLDLQGGVSVVLEPTEEPAEGTIDQAVAIIRNRVDGLGVAEPDIARQGDAIIVQIPGVQERERVLELVGTTAELRFRPVLNVVPAGSVDLEAGPGDGGPPEGEADEPVDGESGNEVDGNEVDGNEVDASADEAGDEGSLGMVPGESAAAPRQQPDEDELDPSDEGNGEPAEESEPANEAGEEPVQEGDPLELTPPEEDEADAVVVLRDEDGEFVYTLGPTLATGRVVETASAALGQFGVWEVPLTMRPGAEGIDRFNATAAQCNPPSQACPTGQLGIVLDSTVQSAPTIQAPRYERDQIRITGEFTEGEAKDLALVLRYGALPIELERQTVQTVSATLGEDSLRAGLIAGAVGLTAVALYMMLYYRALGMVVVLGLGIWGSLLYAVISWLGVTQGLALTLAGVTGIIISVGIAVDSYVVYFERLKEEVKMGRTLRSSAERAFKRAFRTIMAANIATLIGAGVLWWLTVGPVRGFAFFLGLSTILGLVVTWFYTRPVVTLLSRSRWFSEARVVGVASGLAARQPAAPAAGGGQ